MTVDGKLVYKEVVLERLCGHVTKSEVVLADADEFTRFYDDVNAGVVCDHRFVIDDHGPMFDIRICAVCKMGLGTV